MLAGTTRCHPILRRASTGRSKPAGDGLSKLTVVHDGFEGETNTFGQVAGGMPYILSGLKTLLETGEPLAAAAVAV